MADMTPGMPSGQVTIGDLYRELVGMRGDLTRSLSKLEVIESRNSDADRLHSDHEARIRSIEGAVPSGLEGRVMSLEKFRWQVVGALVTINGLAVVVEWLMWSKK
jgi:hypothetical protein